MVPNSDYKESLAICRVKLRTRSFRTGQRGTGNIGVVLVSHLLLYNKEASNSEASLVIGLEIWRRLFSSMIFEPPSRLCPMSPEYTRGPKSSATCVIIMHLMATHQCSMKACPLTYCCVTEKLDGLQQTLVPLRDTPESQGPASLCRQPYLQLEAGAGWAKCGRLPRCFPTSMLVEDCPQPPACLGSSFLQGC